MTNLDQFESEFRAATRTPFEYTPFGLQRGLLITDLAEPDPELRENLGRFLGVGRDGKPIDLEHVAIDSTCNVRELLALVDEKKAEMLVTYRNLHSDAWSWPHSLGDAVDVLTQITDIPVLLVPNPKEDPIYARSMQNTDVVMAITDHLAGDHRLVNYGVALTQPGGKLILSHVEDDETLQRTIEAISKIPSIDTDTVKEELPRQLLKDPLDYAQSCQDVLQEASVDVTIEYSVTLGHQLKDHLHLIAEHQVDLLVLNTKDEDQLAMHGLAYPLAVELRKTPLLML
jgi:nucleotide-binding universal stress UspA family protein